MGYTTWESQLPGGHWADDNPATPLIAAALSHIETGVQAAAAVADGASAVTGTLAGDLATLSSTVAQLTRAITPQAHGAIGDGVADDTAAIQAAVNAAATGPRAVYLPAGTYRTGTITLPAPLSLYGAGPRASTLVLKAGTNGPLLQTPDDGIQRYHLSIADVGLDGRAAQQTTPAPLIHVRAVNEATLRDLYILAPSGPGIRIGQATAGTYCTVPTLRGIVMRGDTTYSLAEGILLDSGSSDAVVDGCDIGFFGGAAGLCLSGHPGAVVTATNVWQCRYGVQLYQANRTRMVGVLSDYAKRHGFVAQRSSVLQLVGCQSRNSGVETANTYDGYRLEGESAAVRATDIALVGCWSDGPQQRVGLALQAALNRVQVVGGSMFGAVSPMVIGSDVDNHVLSNVGGINPMTVTTPAVPSSTVPLVNRTGAHLTVHLFGGTVTSVKVGTTTLPSIPTTVRVPAGQSITITHTAAPAWAWVAD